MNRAKNVYDRYGMALIVSGPSGAGKTTVCRRVLAMMPKMHFSVSCNTRAPRPGERDGLDYRFVTRAEFEDCIDAGKFLEHAEVHGNLCGTLRAEVEDHVRQGRDVLLDIDVQGARQVRERVAGTFLERCMVFVFFAPPSYEELERRLRQRATDTEADVLRRLANARGELAAWAEYQYLVVNDDVDAAVARLHSIVQAGHCATDRIQASPAFCVCNKTNPTDDRQPHEC